MLADVMVTVQQPTDVASARRESLELGRFIGLDTSETSAVAIVVTEAATNLLKHGGGGQLIARHPAALHSGPTEDAVLEIIALDQGKGMTDTVRCFDDGYSTAGSQGTGLGAIARLSHFHQIYSTPGGGTVLVARVGKRSPKMDVVEVGALSLPYPGEQVCGDAFAIATSPGRCRLVVADGLGHGVLAAEASRTAVELLPGRSHMDPVALIETMHAKLRPTRGAALAITDLDLAEGSVAFTGVGNIAGCVIPDSGLRRQMISMNGTVGQEMRKARAYSYPFPPESLLILHSDGLTTQWSLDKYPGLAHCDTSVIAAVLMRDFRRTRDDATVLVVRAAAASE